ncbi:hypothetical protein FHT03_003633 [Xanthomonas arboricola]
MQQVQVQRAHTQPLQAGLAGARNTARAGIAGQYLRHQIRRLPAVDGLADQLLRAAIAVHFGGIDQPHAQLLPDLQRIDLLLRRMPALAQIPRTQPECRYLAPVTQAHLGTGR